MTQLNETPSRQLVAAAPKLGNPAAVGLAAFGMTTLLLQLHALGIVGMGPVLWLGVFYGGAAQVVVGLHEHRNGNNFGYTVFTSFGCFWLSFCGIVVAGKYGLFPASKTDVGWFLVGWTLYSGIMTIASMRTSKVLFAAFATLMVGLVALVAEHFGGGAALTTLSAVSLLGTVACVWYVMAHIVFADMFGRDVLPVGKPLL
ncbi:acetate uptake transporter [Rhodoplanes azumiensis]|uniref:Acetate uptake transporter n=1 Tax=Rhodoplanes azumiensis TaxID=1897628 RepID=A0ABW5AIV0_9BRAD